MSEQPDKQENAQFERANDELVRGLKLCHSLLDDYRSKLAVSVNDFSEFPAANDDDEEEEGQSDIG